MPKVTGNDLVVQTLKKEGVDTVFFLTGGPMSDVAGLCLEMDTAMRHNIPVICVISNNGGWAAVDGIAARDLGFTRYDKMFEPLGCHCEYVEKPDDIRPALERAKASGKPAIVNVVTDPRARASTVKFSSYRAV